VLLGHYRYYGVPRNGTLLTVFRETIRRAWWQTLRRRSQRHRLTWQRLDTLAEHWLPTPRNACASRPEAGARCGSAARRDLCGGHRVTGVPTATLLLKILCMRLDSIP
jgi:hypothetical protein